MERPSSLLSYLEASRSDDRHVQGFCFVGFVFISFVFFRAEHLQQVFFKENIQFVMILKESLTLNPPSKYVARSAPPATNYWPTHVLEKPASPQESCSSNLQCNQTNRLNCVQSAGGPGSQSAKDWKQRSQSGSETDRLTPNTHRSDLSVSIETEKNNDKRRKRFLTKKHSAR